MQNTTSKAGIWLAVAYIGWGISTPVSAEPFFGLDHVPLGSAVLSGETESHNNLVISNIGSSGDDGVEIDTGPADGLAAFLGPDTCPAPGRGGNATLSFGVAQQVRGAANLYDLLIENSGGTWQASATTSGASPCLDTAVIENNEVVSFFECAGFGAELANWPGAACPLATGWIEYQDGPGFGIVFDGVVDFSVDDTPVQGDEIRFFPQNQPEFDSGPYTLTAANVGQVVITNELLQKFGNVHHAEGDARMFPTNQHLALTNLGSSGADGVSVEIIDEYFRAFTQAFLLSDTGGPPPLGARLIAQALGLIGTDGDAPIGTMILTKTSNGIETTFDYTPLGASTVTLEFYDNGTLVQTVTGQSGVLLTTDNFPLAMGVLSSGYPASLPGFIQRYAEPVVFSTAAPAEGNGISADELRVLAEGGPAVKGISQYTFHTAGINQLTIIREVGSVLTDIDIDGVPDVLDNCIEKANASQRDTNGDGYGNRCDADFDGSLFTNFADLQLMEGVFFTFPGDPGYDPDIDLDDIPGINFPDLQIMEELFFLPPGPSAFAP